MFPKINKILYATDLSPNSAYVFRYAVDAARKHGARIVILHIIEPLSPTAEMLISYHLAQDRREAMLGSRIDYLAEQIRLRLRNFIEKELADDADAETLVEKIEISQGFPVEEILKKVDALVCDLIIMGTHGKGIIKNTFLGSTARRLLRRARKPVFIVPLPKNGAVVTNAI
jgi:nucleotide-binding universal stress UspA family protein